MIKIFFSFISYEFDKLFGIANLHKSFKYSSLIRFKFTVEKIDI